MVWIVIVLCLLLVVLLLRYRLRDTAREEAGEDTGLAILEFGQAFPDEAIRAVTSTADGKTVFLWLHDGKTGCMRAHGHHFACHLIQPGTVRVEAVGDRQLSLAFSNAAFEGGVFEFRNSKDAAEVSLWLLGSFRAKPAGFGPTSAEPKPESSDP